MVRAKKSLGQNFLVDPNYQRRIVAALEANTTDTVIEIGPGTGALTQHLVGTVARLILVEKDDALVRALRARWGERADVDIIHGDALEIDFAAVLREPHSARIIGNIPYNITSPLLFRILERAHRPHRLVVMVQKEVADRIVAPPGDRQYGALSVGIRTVAEAARLFVVPRGAFRPAPNVDSAVLRIDSLDPAPLTAEEEGDVRILTRVAFGWRRKQLQRILRDSPEYALDSAAISRLESELGVPFTIRPEELSPEGFVTLARALQGR